MVLLDLSTAGHTANYLQNIVRLRTADDLQHTGAGGGTCCLDGTVLHSDKLSEVGGEDLLTVLAYSVSSLRLLP